MSENVCAGATRDTGADQPLPSLVVGPEWGRVAEGWGKRRGAALTDVTAELLYLWPEGVGGVCEMGERFATGCVCPGGWEGGNCAARDF